MIQICIHTVGANVFIDNPFAWKPPATYREFPPCSVSGFTPLTSLVAAQEHEIFSMYNLFAATEQKHFTIFCRNLYKYHVKLTSVLTLGLRQRTDNYLGVRI